VVRGPFSAVVELTKLELTLMLNGRYAGRFPIGVGRDCDRLEGCYEVRHKVVNPQYYGPDRIDIDADDPNNPYGEFWIGLAEQGSPDSSIGIHGTNDPENLHRVGGRGTICLGNRDIDDLFGILSIGSRVLIRR
jgi:lipoprotein-anchoring transpeptidase ErfK/SrfK